MEQCTLSDDLRWDEEAPVYEHKGWRRREGERSGKVVELVKAFRPPSASNISSSTIVSSVSSYIVGLLSDIVIDLHYGLVLGS